MIILLLTMGMFLFILCVLFHLLKLQIQKLNTLPSYTNRLNAAIDEWKIETANRWKELDKKIEAGYYND
jgi:hypothetical protein